MKSIFIKTLLFCGVYFLMVWLFQLPFLQNNCADVFGKSANVFLSAVLPKGFIHVERAEQAEPCTMRVMFGNKDKVELQMTEAKRAKKADASLSLLEFRIKFQEFVMVPLIFFLALMLITPIEWRSKLKYAAIGCLVLLLFFLLKLLCYTLFNYTKTALGVYELSGMTLRFVRGIYNLKVGMSFLMATVLWLMMTLGKQDWRQVLSKI